MKMQEGEIYKPLPPQYSNLCSAWFYRFKRCTIFKKQSALWNAHSTVSKLFPVWPQATTLVTNGKPIFRVIVLMLKNARILMYRNGGPFHMIFGKHLFHWVGCWIFFCKKPLIYSNQQIWVSPVKLPIKEYLDCFCANCKACFLFFPCIFLQGGPI